MTTGVLREVTSNGNMFTNKCRVRLTSLKWDYFCNEIVCFVICNSFYHAPGGQKSPSTKETLSLE